MTTESIDDATGRVVRDPLPKWKRIFARHSVALDYLSTIIRYRPFDASKDLDPQAKGYLADTLHTGRFFIPAAHALNDPWEAKPNLESVWWRNDKHLELAEFLAFLARDHSTPESFARLLKETRTFPIETLIDRAQQVLLSHLRNVPILSLSDRADIFLMWSYYGHGHNGYALVFDAQKLPFASAVRVAYARRHPRILLVRRDFSGIAVDILGTKARQWRHEREWRVIPPSSNQLRLGFTDFQSAPPMGFHATVSMDSIVGVIVGDQLFRGAHSKAVLALLEAHADRMKFWVAELSRRTFSIALRPLRFGLNESGGT